MKMGMINSEFWIEDDEYVAMNIHDGLKKEFPEAFYKNYREEVERVIIETLHENNYWVFKRTKKGTSLWARLSAPILLIVALLMLMSLPIKWIFTGNTYFPLDKYPATRWLKTWFNKAGM